MEAMQAQVQSLTDELNNLRGEIIAVKGAHAVLHQSTVDAGTRNQRAFSEQAARIESVEAKIIEITSTARLPESIK